VVLNHVHRGWPPLTALCRRLSFETGVRVWANAYLTPANSQGFAHHHDAHSVFIAQTSGSKVWKLYEPAFPAPLDGQSYRTVVAQGDRERLEQQTPALEVTLRAGDVLWVPRGWVHSGRSVDDHSLHVTFGLNPDTPLWLLASALETMTGVEELRRELPWGVVHDPARLADAAASAAKRFAEALAEADWDAFVRDRARAEGRLASDLAGLRLPLYESPPAPNTELLTVRSALQDLALLPDGGVSVRTARQAFTIRGPSGSALFGFLDREEDEPWRLGDLAKETGEQAAVKIVERLADAGVVERWEDHAGR
jgi:hypothetical protein